MAWCISLPIGFFLQRAPPHALSPVSFRVSVEANFPISPCQAFSRPHVFLLPCPNMLLRFDSPPKAPARKQHFCILYIFGIHSPLYLSIRTAQLSTWYRQACWYCNNQSR